jgi:hypothetical protein
MWLIAIFVSMLVLSNILSAKVITIGWLTFPGGILCYAATFLIGDVLGELYGAETSKFAIKCGFIVQILCSFFVVITLILPCTDSQSNTAFDSVFAMSVWSVVASLIAYLASQILDIAIFHHIRNVLKSNGKNWKWVWNNVSTIISQFVDAMIYVGVAFGIGCGYRLDVLGNMVISQIIVKWILAVMDTPLFYLLTKDGGKE